MTLKKATKKALEEAMASVRQAEANHHDAERALEESAQDLQETQHHYNLLKMRWDTQKAKARTKEGAASR